jgi:hypothetical protein
MTEPPLITSKAYTYFAITSDTLTEADCLHWFGMEPDASGTGRHWTAIFIGNKR